MTQDFERLLQQAGVDPSTYSKSVGLPPIPPKPKREPGSVKKKPSPKAPESLPPQLKVGPLEEYADPKNRIKAVSSNDTDRSLKLIYQWIKTDQISYDEFQDLLVEVVAVLVRKGIV